MALKQSPQALQAPDGSYYVTLTDGAGTLAAAYTGTAISSAQPTADATNPALFTAQQTISNLYAFNGTTWDRIRTNAGAADASVTPGMMQVGPWLLNGASYDRQRSINGITQSTGLGAVAAAPAPTGVATAGIANTATATVGTGGLVLKASAGNLFSVTCTSGASAGYFMVFDSTTVPADGVVTPVYVASLAANTSFFTDFAYPIRCATGISVCFSTTGQFTKTISATAFMAGQFI